MRILGIDPGFGRTGWAIVESEKNNLVLVDCGCIETPANTKIEKRLLTIHKSINNLIRKYKPNASSIEELYYFKNAKTVIGVGQARGSILLALEMARLPIFHYTPLQIKQTVTGYGKADKIQVGKMVRNLLKLDEDIKSDDAADACAVAITHSFTNTKLAGK